MEVLAPEYNEILLSCHECDDHFAFRPLNETIAGHEVRAHSIVTQLIRILLKFVKYHLFIVADYKFILGRGVDGSVNPDTL